VSPISLAAMACIGAAAAIMFVSFLFSAKNSFDMYLYLKNHRYARWAELTSVGRFGPGGANPLRWTRYLFDDRDAEDTMIITYKTRVLHGLKLSGIASLVLFVGIVILLHFSKGL